MFVKAISGSYSGVMGLPVFETIELLASAGIDVLEKQR
jgi:septum formation protein